MTRSLQRHLSMMLAVAVFISGVISSVIAFYFAYDEAQELQDDTLRQIAALGIGSRAQLQKLDAAHLAVEDPESRVQLFRLPEGPHPAWLPDSLDVGFHTLSGGPGDMRVFVRRDAGNGWLAVTQSTDSRNEIAFNSALRTLLPILFLLPVLMGLIAFIVRGEFKPLRRLAESLDRQAADRPDTLPEHDLPDEITPFVQAINRLLGRIDGMIAKQRRFIADAAHELRTPLTALSLQAQNLARAPSREEMLERLAPLQAGIERARNLTVQLLDLARLQSGEPMPVEVDIQAMARELISEFLPLAEANGIDLGMEGDDFQPVTADPHILRMILRNALQNAVRYTPRGGEVTLGTKGGDSQQCIEIVDTGPGIPPSQLDKVFEPFHRLSSAIEGSGLGLAIAREAAIQLGGRIVLENRESRSGLVFRICLTSASPLPKPVHSCGQAGVDMIFTDQVSSE